MLRHNTDSECAFSGIDLQLEKISFLGALRICEIFQLNSEHMNHNICNIQISPFLLLLFYHSRNIFIVMALVWSEKMESFANKIVIY